MTHNGRTHSHMVTVLPRPERHSTVIPRPVPPRWTRKKRTRKATVPPFPQAFIVIHEQIAVQVHCHPRTNRRPSPSCCSKSL